jgi:hypothetical protein
VLAELVGRLKEKLDPKKVAATSAREQHQRGELGPNLDRLTVGVDLGDQWSHYRIDLFIEAQNPSYSCNSEISTARVEQSSRPIRRTTA